MESHDPGVGIEYGEGGAPVAIAGLAHGAGIDEIAAIFAERPVGGLGLAPGAITGAVGLLPGSGSAASVSARQEIRRGQRPVAGPRQPQLALLLPNYR